MLGKNTQSVALWEWGRRQQLAIYFGLLENYLFVRKSSSKNKKKWCTKSPISGKFNGKIKIVSTHNLLCRKFADVCWKTATC